MQIKLLWILRRWNRRMEHIRTKEQAMAWLMHNKQIRKKRLEQLQTIAIKKYEERTGLKANYVEVF